MENIKDYEEWKDIKGYEGIYQVSNLGRVKRLAGPDASGHIRKERILKARADKQGYLLVTLYKNGDRHNELIHRLMLKTFCPIENMDDFHVDHINFNTQDNRLENLQWLKPEDNRSKKSGSNWKKVCCIETGIIYPSIREAARQTGIPNNNISKACRGILKTAGGYHWEFVD